MANSGFSTLPLPRRTDDRTPRTPSAAVRRESFARRHPDIPITARREGTRLLFEVREPDGISEYDDASVMMDDLDARYPCSPCSPGNELETAGNPALPHNGNGTGG